MPNRPLPEYYHSEEWVRLRNEIVGRDGHKCRNCGAGDQLEVHHWLPLPAFQVGADRRGYGFGPNPLLVHESGLVTLCRDCHEALTKVRTERAILRNPRLLAISPPGQPERRNVFQLWALGGEEVPFRVTKETWSRSADQFYLIEKIEITKWPYGVAWGRYYRSGKAGAYGKVPNAGVYAWSPHDEQS